MKESYTNDTVAQKEALVNELKGSLFEFLVANELSKELGVYQSFLAHFSKDTEKKSQLQQYESWAREYDPVLHENLPSLAKQTCQDILKYLKNAEIYSKVSSFTGIELTGKFFTGDQRLNDGSRSEADLQLLAEGQITIPISLKLCKVGSFVNSKSAGVNSFIEKYFSPCPLADFFQNELNQALDDSYQQLGDACYQSLGLDFPGSFDHQWTDAGFSELPGQLPKNIKELVHRSYEPVIQTIHRAFQHFLENDRHTFLDSLASLMGFSEEKILQVHCYHSGTSQYHFVESQIYSLEDVFGLEENEQKLDLQLEDLTPGKASFEVNINKEILQIRVKPMNKFTSKSHKINCSIKRRTVAQ